MSSACPTATVVIPSYNGEKTLGRCVDSVLTQSLCGVEVLIVDDASTDGTREILSQYKDPRVRCLFMPHNSGGPALPMSAGVAAASGEYVGIIDQDDCAHSHWLQAATDALSAASSIGMAWGWRAVCDEHGRRTSIAFVTPFRKKASAASLPPWR